jgi:hypothetical protein
MRLNFSTTTLHGFKMDKLRSSEEISNHRGSLNDQAMQE